MANKFLSLRIRSSQSIFDEALGVHVYHVTDPHALTQASGYLKYAHAKSNERVYFRGQSALYKTLSPTLYRGVASRAAQDTRTVALSSLMEATKERSASIRALAPGVAEPLLQHYGLRTSWLDVVDNIWVALWFACHKAHSEGVLGKHVHFERRQVRYEENSDRFAYILLIEVDATNGLDEAPGLWRGRATELIDLRLAAPSTYLRPHAQHGLLFRLKGGSERRKTNYSERIAGIIRVDLESALEWLGEGRLLQIHSLFPPPVYDPGYAQLLEDFSGGGLPCTPLTGTIQHIGA